MKLVNPQTLISNTDKLHCTVCEFIHIHTVCKSSTRSYFLSEHLINKLRRMTILSCRIIVFLVLNVVFLTKSSPVTLNPSARNPHAKFTTVGEFNTKDLQSRIDTHHALTDNSLSCLISDDDATSLHGISIFALVLNLIGILIIKNYIIHSLILSA